MSSRSFRSLQPNIIARVNVNGERCRNYVLACSSCCSQFLFVEKHPFTGYQFGILVGESILTVLGRVERSLDFIWFTTFILMTSLVSDFLRNYPKEASTVDYMYLIKCVGELGVSSLLVAYLVVQQRRNRASSSASPTDIELVRENEEAVVEEKHNLKLNLKNLSHVDVLFLVVYFCLQIVWFKIVYQQFFPASDEYSSP